LLPLHHHHHPLRHSLYDEIILQKAEQITPAFKYKASLTTTANGRDDPLAAW
jgi:hypothetical protein